MNLYKIHTEEQVDYDRYDAMVVAAKDEAECRQLSDKFADSEDSDWQKRKDLKVSFIGRAVRGTKPGVILASFNAG